VDLVAMTTHGRSGLMRGFFGSVTEVVLRHSPCPVLAVRYQAET
jgi:universal stress protein A